jgi:hypothetical protein
MTDMKNSGDSDHPRSVDLRQHRRRTERDLILGGAAILFIIGGGLVWFIYGFPAAMAGWGCMLGGVLLAGLLY